MTPFCLAVLLAALALLGRGVGRNWLAPVAFAPLVWVGLMMAAGLLQAALPLRPEGLWIILTMVVAFQVGALVVHHAARSESIRGPAPDGSSYDDATKRLTWGTGILSVLSAMGVLLLLRTGAASVGLSLSLGGLLRLGNMLTVMRYAGVDDLPGVVKVFLYWTFAAALLGGMLAAVAGSFARRLLSVLPLFVVLGSGVIVAARSGLLIAVVMWLGGFWAMRICTSGGAYSVFRVKWILGVGVSVLLLIGSSAILLWLRAGVWRSLILESVASSTLNDFFGSVSAFTTWFAGAGPLPLTLGAYTFAGPFDFFGLAPRLQGVYGTAVTFLSGGSSNIYTLFRGLIQDFGLVGAWGACFVAGALGTIAYKQCRAGRMHWTVPLSLVYATIMFSHLYSLFTHNSVALGWVAAAAVWFWPRRAWSVAAGPRAVAGPQAQESG